MKPQNDNKQFNLILQSKGGVGKSFLAYLLALKNEKNESVFFVDLDNSTKTSISQLKFLVEKQRLAEINLSNRESKIDRERLFSVLEHLNDLPFSTFYLDCGAPESEQIPNLFTKDFTPEELKEFETQLSAKIVFNIVIAGGSAYTSSMNYLEQILILKDLFTINIYCNEWTFRNTPELLLEAEKIALEQIIGFNTFGEIYPDRASGQEILINAKNGQGIAHYSSFAAKTHIRKELNKI